MTYKDDWGPVSLVPDRIESMQIGVDELRAANERIRELEAESEAYAQLQARCFDQGGSSVFDEVRLLKAALTAEREVSDKLEKALELVLPMAKGYAVANRVGSNDAYIKLAAAALTEVAAIRNKEKHHE